MLCKGSRSTASLPYISQAVCHGLEAGRIRRPQHHRCTIAKRALAIPADFGWNGETWYTLRLDENAKEVRFFVTSSFGWIARDRGSEGDFRCVQLLRHRGGNQLCHFPARVYPRAVINVTTTALPTSSRFV